MVPIPRFLPTVVLCALPALPLAAAITISGVADKTGYDNSVSFTVTADPAAATTTATLDGAPVAVGAAVLVNSICYHELKAESRTTGNVLVDSRTVRFIVRDSTRNGSEDGIPARAPYRTVNDAPSAFAGGTLKVIAPAAWPAGLPVPMAFTLRTGAGEPLWLNGRLALGGFPGTMVQMRRGWASVVAPAVAAAGPLAVGAQVAGLVDSPEITIEAAPVFTAASGTITANTVWPANSRIHVTGTLTINAGATLTVGAGSVIQLYSGNGTAGSAAEIVVNGTLDVQGAEGNPVVFAPDTAGGKWGGIELPAASSTLTAQHAIFTGAGEDQTWFSTHSGYTYHKAQQSLFLLSGSGSGTAVGARLQLADCYCFDLGGTLANSKTNTRFDLQRCLLQRAVGGGQLNGCLVTIDRSALIEFPAETAEFVDADNDSMYLTNGDLSITRTVLGFTKDDGIDSGGSGGDNPFTAAADVTPLVSTGNWFEGTFHEGNSMSGKHDVTHTGCVFLNCGQGVEDGYTGSATGYGPNAVVDRCLLVGNLVGARYGDNYNWDYNGVLEVRNSLLLHNAYHDAWGYDWTSWTYNGVAKFNVHDNHLSQPDPLHHPANTAWDPATHGALLAPFMPVPGAAVGVAVCSYAPAQGDPSTYPGAFTVRLSTFSSLPVAVDWAVVGKAGGGGAESVLASGALAFAPGETIKTIDAPVAAPAGYDLLRVALTDPLNAEVTGEAWYFKTPATDDPNLVARGASGWRYRETRSEPPAAWKNLDFDDSSPAATEWLPCTLPAGFALTTQFSPAVAFATSVGYGGNIADKTKTYYFRRKFTVEDPAQITALTFSVRRDDGIVMWLNNPALPTVVSADGTFNAPYSYAGLAPNATSTGTYLTYSVPASQLVAGTNILAVELHQTSITSSDLLLDCGLVATYAAPFELAFDAAGGQPVLYWFDSAALLEESSDLHHWSPVPAGLSPFPFAFDVPARFFRLRK